MVDNEERDATLVQDLINFKSQLDDIMQHAFVGATTHHETEITTNTAPLRGGRGAATATVASPTASTTTTADEWKEKFNNALRESIESFINRRHNKPAELLSRFLDAKLRGKETAAAATSSASTPISSNDSLEVTLDKTLVLFRFIRGKDVFEAYYKKDLAKRLLAGKSSSVDLERSVLGKLRAECGV